jgi:hypothetical protein
MFNSYYSTVLCIFISSNNLNANDVKVMYGRVLQDSHAVSSAICDNRVELMHKMLTDIHGIFNSAVK